MGLVMALVIYGAIKDVFVCLSQYSRTYTVKNWIIGLQHITDGITNSQWAVLLHHYFKYSITDEEETQLDFLKIPFIFEHQVRKR